jgi:divalent metal cation (Fe/Co/Zn/Cd) transporter
MTSMVTFFGLSAWWAKISYEHGHMRIAMLSSFGAGMLLAASLVVGHG